MQNELIFVGPDPNMTPDEQRCPGHKCTEGGPCENTGKRQLSACRGKRLRERQLDLAWTSGPPELRKSVSVVEALQSVVLGYGNSCRLILVAEKNMCFADKNFSMNGCIQSHEDNLETTRIRPFQRPTWCFYRFGYIFVKLLHKKSILDWRDDSVDKVLVP